MTNRSYLSCCCLLAFFLGGASTYPIFSQCNSPELLQATTVTDSVAVLTWTDVGDAYILELRDVDTPLNGTPTHWVNQDPPFMVTGLIPGTQYRFRLRTICAPGDTSAWSVVRTFLTDLNNARPCPLDISLRDTSCNNPDFFRLHVDEAPGSILGTDVVLRGVRLMVEHSWRSDLSIWLTAPDGTRRRLIGGLNAGDRNIGDPEGQFCSRFVELTDDTLVARPLSTAAEKDNFTGYYLPVESLAGFHNGQDPKGTWMVEICDSKANDKGRLRVFGLVFARPDCMPPVEVSVSNIQESSAQLHWLGDTVGTHLLIEYGPSGFQPGTDALAGTGGIVTLLSQPAGMSWMLNGLQPLQWYDVYIRRQCSPGVWSANSYAATLFTSCPPSLLETVDILGICPSGCSSPCPLPGLWQNVPDDDYDWKVRSGPGLTYPNAGPPGPSEGSGNYLFFRNSCSFSGAFGKKAVLRTRCVEILSAPGASCYFSLELYMNAKVGQMGSLVLQISEDAGQSWTTLKTWAGNQGKQWRREYIDLGAYSGKVVLLQLIANGAFGSYGDIAIDNMAFYGAEPAGTPDYIFYRDQDGDGFGNGSLKLIACNPDLPVGYSEQAGDCNDSNPAVYPGAPEILCNGTDDNCNGMSDDALIATPFVPALSICRGEDAVLEAAGIPAGTFYWYGNEQGGPPVSMGSQFLISGLEEDTVVYLMDSLPAGCTSARYPVTITVHPTPDLSGPSSVPLCSGMGLDLASLPISDPAGGSLSYYSNWPLQISSLLTNTTVNPDTLSRYYIRSLTSFGCFDTLSVFVEVLPLPSVMVLEGDSMELCKNTSATLTAQSAGMAPLSLLWSNDLTFGQIPVQSGVGSGTVAYHVTVTDGNGCTASDGITVTTLNSISQTSILNVQQVSSCGGGDGSITLQPLNGAAPFAIQWAGPGSGQLSGISGPVTISNLSQGGYRVSITDALGCSMTLPQIVLNAPGLTVFIDTISQPSCPDIADGCINLSVNGTSPVINWSHGVHTTEACNLPPGMYSVTITDGNCQQVLSDIAMESPPGFQAISNQISPVLCAGDDSGAIDLAVFGATPPYYFLWSNADTTQAVSQLGGGIYFCTITDAKGCVFESGPYTVNEAPPLAINPDTVADVRCHGGKDGLVAVSVSGGVAPYAYQWSHGALTAATGAVPAGSYQLTVTDANGCTVTWAGIIGQPAALSIQIDGTPPTCEGLADGSLQAVVTGGIMPYDYNWSTGAGTSVLNGLEGGPYQLTVVDANACVGVSTVQSLTAGQEISIELDSIVPVRCFGDATGYIAVSLDGAQGDVDITWNGQPGGPVLNQLPAGTYILGAVDERGCRVQDTIYINQPAADLQVLPLEVGDALCHGEPNGSISVQGQGGTSPYFYQWNNGDTTAVLAAVSAGNYTVTITDMAGCTVVSGALSVGEPPAFTVQAQIIDVPCFGLPTGEIHIQVSGGVMPATYIWNTGDTSAHVYNLAPGPYSVTIVDGSGCAQVLGDLEVRLRSQQFAVAAVEVAPVSCAGAADGLIRVRAQNGQGPYQFAWSAPIGLHANIAAEEDAALGLSGGLYSVTVTDALGCFTVSPVFQVEEAPPVVLSVDTVIHNICKNAFEGSIALSGSGGLPPYHFQWMHGDTLPLADSLPAGIYFVTLSDLQGCTRQAGPIVLSEPAFPLSLQLDSLQNDDCGQHAGRILVKVTGGVQPYRYEWSDGSAQNERTGLSAGSYQLTVTDTLGCRIVSPVYTISGPIFPIYLDNAEVLPVACFGDSTGQISLEVQGGEPPYDWIWNSGHNTANPVALPAGSYTYTVTDQTGCFLTGVVAVTQPAAPLELTASSAWAGTDWTVTLSVSGGTSPYQALWDAAAGSQTGLTAVGLPDGVYQVVVTDDAGCTRSLLVDPRTVGTIESLDKGNWKIYPNPGSDRVWLSGPGMRPMGVVISSITGAQERTYDQFTAGEMLEISDMPPGLYLVTLRFSDGRVQCLRFIKTGF